jgi:NADH-quinone oxidoreductase subunit J
MDHLLAIIGQHLFVAFGLLAAGSGAVMVFAKTAVHSVMAFLVSALSIAACFLCLEAEFLAVAQILIYAGGIVVLFLFVVMLVEMRKYKEKSVFQLQMPYAIAAVVAGIGLFTVAFRQTLFGPNASQALTLRPEIAMGLDVAKQNAQAVSRGLFTEYLLPFEILSVILLVALVGAVVLAKSERV